MDSELIRATLLKGVKQCGWNEATRLEVLLDALEDLCDPPCIIMEAIERRIRADLEMSGESDEE